VPAEYVAHLLDIAGRFNVRPEQLLKGTGVKVGHLERGLSVPRPSFLALVLRALELTGEPGLGYYHGLALKLSSHGAVGLLAMTSGTLREALLVAERYITLRANEVRLQTRLEQDSMVLEFSTPGPPQLQLFFSESMFIMLLHVSRSLVGHGIAARCEMPFPEPAHFRRFAHLLPSDVRFSADTNRLLIPAHLLDEALLTSDSVTARRVERECQRELAELSERASFLTTLNRHIRPEAGDFPSLEELADRMNSSTRTLKRKLALSGTSYRKLVDDLRRDRARELLTGSDLPLEKIASMLGYSDTASLHRSSRRWFEGTASKLRNQT
jgi:AraC-like DNA-binding protein